MSYFQSTYHSRVYKDFKEIESDAHREIIRFFEKHQKMIDRLDFEEYFELLVAYVEALFEIGIYQKHIVLVDEVIENTINLNIQRYKGEDIYYLMLFKKAASHFNLHQYEKAEHILRELVKMNPDDKEVLSFLKRCLRRRGSQLLSVARASSIFLFLLTACIICVEVLFVRPFYEMYASRIEALRIGTFVVGVFALIAGDFLHRVIIEAKVNSFAEKVKDDKKK
jgi:tetratricopeptide (TPR) repeat protein